MHIERMFAALLPGTHLAAPARKEKAKTLENAIKIINYNIEK